MTSGCLNVAYSVFRELSFVRKLFLILSWNVLLPNVHLLFLLQNHRKLSIRPFPCDIFQLFEENYQSWYSIFFSKLGFCSQLYVYCIHYNFHFLSQPELYCLCSLVMQNSLRQSLSLILIWSLINRLINSQKPQTILRQIIFIVRCDYNNVGHGFFFCLVIKLLVLLYVLNYILEFFFCFNLLFSPKVHVKLEFYILVLSSWCSKRMCISSIFYKCSVKMHVTV